MNRDHLLGWPPSLLALDPEPRKSLRTPIRVRLSDASQREMRDIDRRETQALTRQMTYAQAKPAAAPAEVAKPVEWLYFKGGKTGAFYRRRGPREQLYKWVDGKWHANAYSGPTGPRTNYDPITPDQLPKEALA